jgi:hypothetical protein
MPKIGLRDWNTKQAAEKLGRRVRAIADIPLYGIKQAATGLVTHVLRNQGGTADLVVTWDHRTITVLGHRRKLQGCFDRDYYERVLEETDGR